MVISTAKLTSKYQITIPAEVRQRLGLKEGDYVDLAIEGNEVVLRAAQGSWVERTKGLGKELWEAEGGAEAYLKRERESWDE